MYAGDYDGAEAAYRSLAQQGVTGAAAHLATLLDYEGRFTEAVTEAQAGVAAHSDADSLGRLARALDWAQDIRGAVAAGQQAVNARPATPLAHLFYAEALSDSGRFDASRSEIESAASMGGDAFTQSETAREWANYYRDRNDMQSELNENEIAAKLQPGFPERQLEVIRTDYGDQRPTQAQSLATSFANVHARSYPLLVSLADAALFGGDGQRATALYRAAATLRPDGVQAALGQAEMAIVLNRDFTAAHDVALSALQRNQTSGQLYQLVRYIDVLALKRDPADELGPAPGDLAASRGTVLKTLNSYRSAAGLGALQEDASLDDAAQAHAYYYFFNLGQSQLTSQGLTAEDSTLPGFTGASPQDRDRHFGFAGARSTELYDHIQTPAGSIDGWMGEVLARFPLLTREAGSVGYGQAGIGSLTFTVLDVGDGAAGTGDAVSYPAAGQSGVPAAYLGESPDPLPQGATTPAGFPITLEAGGAQQLAISAAQVTDAAGRPIASYAIGPGGTAGAPNLFALVPHQPLSPGAYRVQVTGTVDGQALDRNWSFTVAS